MRGFLAHVHSFGHPPPRLIRRQILRELAPLVKQQHRRALGALSKEKRPNGRDGHQKVFVQKPAFGNVGDGTPKHVRSGGGGRRGKQREAVIRIPEYKSAGKNRRRSTKPRDEQRPARLLSRLRLAAAVSAAIVSAAIVFVVHKNHPL
jgi:hypothetical protein